MVSMSKPLAFDLGGDRLKDVETLTGLPWLSPPFIAARFEQIYWFARPHFSAWRTTQLDIAPNHQYNTLQGYMRPSRSGSFLEQACGRILAGVAPGSVLLSARPAQVRQGIDLRDKPRQGWQLGAELRQIEAEVTARLLESQL